MIAAEGEFQASERLKDAAMVIETHPVALQLRYLQTLIEISTPLDDDRLPRAGRHPRGFADGSASRRRAGRELSEPPLAALRLLLAEAAGGVDRGAEVHALVLGLLDQHHGLDRVHVVDPLLLALRRDLRLVRPVVELHLRDAREATHLAEIQLDLVEMLARSTAPASTCFV